MALPPTVEEIRNTILKIFQERSSSNQSLSSSNVLEDARNRLNLISRESEQLLLTIFYDMFRTGYIAWGLDIANPNPPWFHLTEQGRTALSTYSIDPVNQEGYIAYLQSNSSLSDVSISYVKEALKTYNADCWRASAVMLGAALESAILDLRNKLVNNLGEENVTSKLKNKNSSIKVTIKAIESKLNEYKAAMDYDLKEWYDELWSSMILLIRKARNDAGHPSSLISVTPELTHASFLRFHPLAKLLRDLGAFIDSQPGRSV